jgi:hypothetical protein
MLSFRKLQQISGETIDAFTDRLRIEAKRKGIANAEDNIRLQLISGAISNKIRLKAETEDMTLQDLVNFARTVETHNEQSHVQKHQIQEVKQEQINQVQKQYNYNNTNHQYQQGPHQYQKNGTNKCNQHQGQNKSNTCGMCGYEYPHKGLCPAQGKQCNSCRKLNHFTKCCRSKNQTFNSQSEQNKYNQYNNQPVKKFFNGNQNKHQLHLIHVQNQEQDYQGQSHNYDNNNYEEETEECENNNNFMNSSNNMLTNQSNNVNISSNLNATNASNLETDCYNVYAVKSQHSTRCPRVVD